MRSLLRFLPLFVLLFLNLGSLYPQTNFSAQFNAAITAYENREYANALRILDTLGNSLFADYLDDYRLKCLYPFKNQSRINQILNGVMRRQGPLLEEILCQHFHFQEPSFFADAEKIATMISLIPTDQGKANGYYFCARALAKALKNREALGFLIRGMKIFPLKPLGEDSQDHPLHKLLELAFKILKTGTLSKNIPTGDLLPPFLYSCLDPALSRHDVLLVNLQPRIEPQFSKIYQFLLMDYHLRVGKLDKGIEGLTKIGDYNLLPESLQPLAKYRSAILLNKKGMVDPADQLYSDLLTDPETTNPFRIHMNRLAIAQARGNLTLVTQCYREAIRYCENPYTHQKLVRDYFDLALRNRIPFDPKTALARLVTIMPTGNYMEEILYLAWLQGRERPFLIDTFRKFQPHSFFLKHIDPKFQLPQIKNNRQFYDTNPPPESDSFARGMVFEKMGRDNLALREFNRARTELPKDIRVLLAIARNYEKQLRYREGIGMYEAAFNQIAIKEGNVREIPPLIWRAKYPIFFQPEITSFSNANGVDPFLTCAIIREESRFDPNAVSRSGARGLMQIMPKTGRWIIKNLKKPPILIQSLFGPKLNIELGAWYIQHLLQKFNNIYLAICSYNGGPGNVKKIMAVVPGTANTNILEFWSAIHLPETKRYLYKVASSYFVYLALYS